MDNLVKSRSARWKVFGIILLIICVVGVIKGFVSARYSSDTSVASPDKSFDGWLARTRAANESQIPTAPPAQFQPDERGTTPQQDLGSWTDKTLAVIRKRNSAVAPKLPDTLPGTFTGWDEQKPKTLSVCQAKVSEWELWYDSNIAAFENLKVGDEQLRKENSELDSQNSKIRNELKIAEPIALFSGLLGLGAGIGIVYFLARWLRRTRWPLLALSRDKKRLFLLIGGAAWISAVVMICSQEQILYLHPINLLVAVLVYSILAILFGGISLWWLKRPEKN